LIHNGIIFVGNLTFFGLQVLPQKKYFHDKNLGKLKIDSHRSSIIIDNDD